ncbi:SAM-dependent methyltransferase [Kutzneria chonburiensis]|uniref:SAM-dependent methyltransferase n=1 Tax=Kutzneria chonburiensis TaxID=1483604 RepID=A0ABV6MYB8_9PSEU|nr:SAM-dependent methyltransferase [Kutzneria chonburiensis]
MELPDWVPATMDVSKPSPARMYDYYLGGTHNFEVDRDAAERAIAAMPYTIQGARGNRDFLRRAVRLLVDAGIHQLLDLGSGIPTVGNVHEVAQRRDPTTRVVYVDIDPVAVAHSTAILRHNHLAGVLQADMRDVDAVLSHPRVRDLIDFSEPVGLIMASVLHFVPDSSKPADIVAAYRDAVPTGSHLVLSHIGSNEEPGNRTGMLADFKAVYQNTTNPVVLRTRPQIEAFFDGFSLLEPGVTLVHQWRPDADQELPAKLPPGYGGVGVKP